MNQFERTPRPRQFESVDTITAKEVLSDALQAIRTKFPDLDFRGETRWDISKGYGNISEFVDGESVRRLKDREVNITIIGKGEKYAHFGEETPDSNEETFEEASSRIVYRNTEKQESPPDIVVNITIGPDNKLVATSRQTRSDGKPVGLLLAVQNELARAQGLPLLNPEK